MRSILTILVFALSSQLALAADPSFLGFDRNQYPGDDALARLHQTFAFTGYWLNSPPGTKGTTWIGKRARLQNAGFGFLVLFNGRLYRALGKEQHAHALGEHDAREAIAAARREGFPQHTIIFLDQEEGGRLLREQRAYLFAWIDTISASDFRAGVYCSGIPAQDPDTAGVITARDIRQNAGSRNIAYWVTNDGCPPSPGCVSQGNPPQVGTSGIDFAEAWQFAQSPKRKDVAAACRGYDPDGSCYVPGLEKKVDADLDVAKSADPSHGRTH